MELIVFDIDGTLVGHHPKRNERAYLGAFKEALGIVQDDSWDSFQTSTDSGIAKELMHRHYGRDLNAEELSRVRSVMTRLLEVEYGTEPFPANPGALELWSHLQGHPDYHVAIATGNWDFAARFKLKSAGFSLGSTPVASADDHTHRAELLRVAEQRSLAALGLERFSRCTYVGDWTWDFRAAREVNWNFIGMAANGTEAALRSEGAERILHDFHGLLGELGRAEA